jgi:hypothetical protein
MPHRNAPLSELGRLRLARCVVDQGWPVAVPPSGSRSAAQPPSGGRPATATRGRPG